MTGRGHETPSGRGKFLASPEGEGEEGGSPEGEGLLNLDDLDGVGASVDSHFLIVGYA